ncbi:peptide ABC transporter permease [Marinomonas sp. 42_23_T18]|nr:peptide ABC transporter permease [Marinomonas sp. 42_23_T18]
MSNHTNVNLEINKETSDISFFQKVKNILPKSKIVLIALTWFSTILFIAIFANFLAPMDYQEINLFSRLLPPASSSEQGFHLLGTDHLGRDISSRMIMGLQLSILVAALGTIIGAFIGISIGFISAHFGGLIDDIIMVFVDFQASMPFVIIALAVLAVTGTGNLLLFVLLVGFQGWEKYARITRGLSLAALNHGYAESVRLLGGSSFRVYLKHILPNIFAALIIQMSINFPETIILETSLSFLGVGIQPPNTSLGNILSYGRDYLLNAWWIAVTPGAVIFLTALSMSIIGDWLRDILDPITKE